MIDAARLIPENWVRARLPRRFIAELRAEEAMANCPTTRPIISDAPGLTWRWRNGKWEARWRARRDLIKRGYEPKLRVLWRGIDESELTEVDRALFADRCRSYQDEMLIWGRGGLPTVDGVCDGTLRSLIGCYETDPDSRFQKQRFGSRQNHGRTLARITAKHGDTELREINARLLLRWHEVWSEGGKISMGSSFVAQLRSLFSFGATILEDRECERLCGIMHKMRFPMGRPRTERITADQAVAVRAKAHEMGWHSIALAQAIQFELMLRQKDVIGEWVPHSEPGTSEILVQKLKWITGLRWSEIDENLILRHRTSKRGKDIEVDLKLAPMILEELQLIPVRPASGPVIVSEFRGRGLPWVDGEFRRRWRAIAEAAGVPANVRNMDSRAGGISEATDGGADLESVRHAATHSNITTTQRYSRGSVEKVANVMQIRAAHRKKNEGGTT